MRPNQDKVWPYNKALAFAAIPIVWIFFAVIFRLGQKYAGWQNTLQTTVILIVAAISLLPLLLVLIDFFASRGTVLDIKGFKIDFSKINLDTSGIKRESFGLPDNIGITGPLISDTSVINIITELKNAVKHEVVVINIKSGESWWVTRLLALSAGAVRAGSPSVLVFIGKKENAEHTFLGLAKPNDILSAILDDKEQYKIRYRKATDITKQVLIFKDSPLKHLLNDPIPVTPALVTAFDIIRYINDPQYALLGEEVTEQIIMDQMANDFGYLPAAGSLEKEPDRLTLKRLEELLAPCLYKNIIDLDNKNEEQIDQLLKSKSSYIALVKNGRYDSILKRSDGERLILKELFNQSKQTTDK